MARKKKEPEAVVETVSEEAKYYEAGMFDNLVKISIKTGTGIEQLRTLNPDIRNCMYLIRQGQKVRIG